jgi:hypothetical protein
MKMAKVAIVALGLTMLAGAAPAQVGQRLAASVTTDTSVNTVTVQNDRKVPVTVYMDWGPFDRRLGTVGPLGTATLPLPAWAVAARERIQLFAHPEGQVDDLATEELSLQPPARLGMIVPSWGDMQPAPTDTMMQVIPPDELADATLTVDNPRATAVTVFAENGPFDIRLGQVPAHGRVTLRFPQSAVAPDESIQVFVHPEGGVDLASGTLEVRPGQHLGLRVPTR